MYFACPVCKKALESSFWKRWLPANQLLLSERRPCRRWYGTEFWWNLKTLRHWPMVSLASIATHTFAVRLRRRAARTSNDTMCIASQDYSCRRSLRLRRKWRSGVEHADRSKTQSLRGLLAGAVGGLIACFAMSQFYSFF